MYNKCSGKFREPEFYKVIFLQNLNLLNLNNSEILISGHFHYKNKKDELLKHFL